MLLFTALFLLQIDEMAMNFGSGLVFSSMCCPFLPSFWGNPHALELFAMPTLLKPLTAFLASLFLDQLFYYGLAGPHYLLEKNI